MKKFYNAPSINISLFISENVVTASGQVDQKIAQTDAENWLKEKIGATAVILTF